MFCSALTKESVGRFHVMYVNSKHESVCIRGRCVYVRQNAFRPFELLENQKHI